jgi:ABC-type multidrug transport system fused ATPase/permease subunit
MDRPILPRTIIGYVIGKSGIHQLGLAALSAAVFGLSAVPLELQRRIVNDAIKSGATRTILWLAIAYAGVAVLEQGFKLALNVYRGWVSEDAVRTLRLTVQEAGVPLSGHDADATDSEQVGTHTAMVVAEVEPIGGFVGMAISEPLLQGGILMSVIGYMTFLEPWTLVLCAAFLLPQMLFVPLMQQAINRRAGARIMTLRGVSGDIVDTGVSADAGIEHVFALNMGIYKIKYSMNMAMNLMYALAVAVALGAGGWLAVAGRIEVGTVVAVVSGLGKLNDPWGDLVSWAREWSVDSVKYRLFADAVNGKGLATA